MVGTFVLQSLLQLSEAHGHCFRKGCLEGSPNCSPWGFLTGSLHSSPSLLRLSGASVLAWSRVGWRGAQMAFTFGLFSFEGRAEQLSATFVFSFGLTIPRQVSGGFYQLV